MTDPGSTSDTLKPMRVLLATPAFLPATGGAERSADRVARGLAERGHAVTVLTRRRPGYADPPAPYRVVRPKRLSRRWRERLPWAEAFWMRAWQARLRADVTLAFYAWPFGFAAAQSRRRLSGPPVVACPRGVDLYPDHLATCRPAEAAAIAWGYGHADRIIAISGSMGDRALAVARSAGHPQPPVDAVPNGVDAAALRAEAAGIAHPLGGRPYALTLSRLVPIKRHATAVEAVRLGADSLRAAGAAVVFAGDGPEAGALRAQAERSGVGDLVHLAGEVHGVEKAAWLAHAAVGLSCSAEEGMPNAVLEQLALGVPVLLSAIQPHEELLAGDAGGRAGSLLAVGDAAAVAAALVAELTGKASLDGPAAAALADRYGVDRMIDGYERSLRAAMAG